MTRFYEWFWKKKKIVGLDSKYPIDQTANNFIGVEVTDECDSAPKNAAPAAKLSSCPSDDLQSVLAADEK